MVFIFRSVFIVNTHETAGEGHDLAESDEDGFFDLTFRLDVQTAEEQYESTKSKESGGDELYVEMFFHKLF